MPRSLPSLGLLAVLVLFWLERRLIGGRATLSFARFREAFVLGCVGAPLAALLFQRVMLQFLPVQIAAWTCGPVIEEIAKTAPVAILVLFFGAARWLSIADLTLLGLASGLGFEFVETNLRILASSRPAVPGLSYLFDNAQDPRVDYIFSGHGTTAALIALGLAIGFRFLRTSSIWKWIPAAAAFTICCFDHCMVNWKILHTEYLFGQVQSVARASEMAERVYVLTLHGAMEAVLLLTGLVLACWWEGRLCQRAMGDRREFLLPGETRPLVLTEWMVALSRLKLGRLPFFQTLAYFRLRRSYALAAAENAQFPEHAEAAKRRAARLYELKGQVADPVASDWVPPRGLWGASIRKWLKRYGWVLCSRLLVALLFVLVAWLPEPVIRLTRTTVFSLAMIGMSLALTLPRMRAFRAQPRLDPSRADAEGVAARYHSGLLLLLSLFSSVAAVFNFLLGGKLLLAAHPVFISDALEEWVQLGGNPATLLGMPGLLTTEAKPPQPCEGLRNEVNKGDARIKEMQERLRSVEILPGSDVPYYDPTRPLVTLGTMPGTQMPEQIPDLLPKGPTSSGPGGRRPHSEVTASQVPGAGGSLPRGGAIVNIGTMPGTQMPDQIPDLLPKGPASSGPGGGPQGPTGNAARVVKTREEYDADRAALQAEMAAQIRRLDALADCEKRAARAPAVPPTKEKKKPIDISALQREADAAKREFEALERELNDVVEKDLAGIRDFLQGYDEQWKNAIDYVQKYIGEYPGLLGDYKKILDQFRNRDWALRLANITDETLQVAMMMATEGLLGGLEQAKYLKTLEEAAQSAKAARAALAAEKALGAAKGLEAAEGGLAAQEASAALKTAKGMGAAEADAAEAKAVAREAKAEGAETVKGAGEGRPPDWETQKLGPEGAAEEPAGAETKTLSADKTEVRAPGDKELGDYLDQAKARQDAAERALQKANERAVKAGYKDAADMDLNMQVQRRQAQLRDQALEEYETAGKSQNPLTGKPMHNTLYGLTEGEATEAAAERYALRNSLEGTKYSPTAAEVNLNANKYQLEDLVTGKGKTLAPTEENVRAIYKNYEQALNNVKEGSARFEDYFSRMDPGSADILKNHLENGKYQDIDYWLARLRQLGQ